MHDQNEDVSLICSQYHQRLTLTIVNLHLFVILPQRQNSFFACLTIYYILDQYQSNNIYYVTQVRLGSIVMQSDYGYSLDICGSIMIYELLRTLIQHQGYCRHRFFFACLTIYYILDHYLLYNIYYVTQVRLGPFVMQSDYGYSLDICGSIML